MMLRHSVPVLAAVVLTAGPGSGVQAQVRPGFLPPDPRGDEARPEVAPPETPVAPAPLQPVDEAAAGLVLRGIAVEGATAIAPQDLAPLWQHLIGTRVTIAEIEAVAAGIGARYRSEGYVLSQAIVPEQVVEEGVVTILVIEGFIDRVAIQGGTQRAQEAAGRFVAPAAGTRPLQLEALERGVLLSRDTLGGTVETVLEPSPSTFGAADMTVLIAPKPVDGFAAIDNLGAKVYGEGWTATLGATAYGYLGLNERLGLLVAGTPTDLGALGYIQGTAEIPLPSLNGTVLDGAQLELFADYANSEPDLDDLGAEGFTVTLEETNLAATLFVPFIRTRSQNLFGRIGLGWLDSDTVNSFAGNDESERDRLLVLFARATWDRADRIGGVSLVEAELRQGIDAGGLTQIGSSRPGAPSADFTSAGLKLARLQDLGSDWSVYGELQGQAASTILPNAERFLLGNSTIGRGFAPGNTTGDAGYGGRLELRRLVPVTGPGESPMAAELYAFGDYGQAYDRSFERDGNKWETLASFGIGARIDLSEGITIIPEVARQLEGFNSDSDTGDRETRFLISVVARF
jgi:hemolysin activation/secretion protein